MEQSPSKANSVDLSQEDSSAVVNRLNLDSPVDDEGNNLSVGQVQWEFLNWEMISETVISSCSDLWFLLLEPW